MNTPVLDYGSVSLLSVSPIDPALSVVNSARVSYDSSSEAVTDKDIRLISYLRSHGHTSPFRHCYLTFHIKAPLFVMRQWMKYQVGSTWRSYETVDGDEVVAIDHMYDTDKGCSWNEQSGRYTEMAAQMYTPAVFRTQSQTNKQGSAEPLDPYVDLVARNIFQMAMDNSYLTYERLIKKGVAKEIARMILPQNIYTQAYWTVSLQGLLHFLDERLKPEAQYEIREYAKAIQGLIEDKLRPILGVQ
jgi:thymidylate synthase (FAD)